MGLLNLFGREQTYKSLSPTTSDVYHKLDGVASDNGITDSYDPELEYQKDVKGAIVELKTRYDDNKALLATHGDILTKVRAVSTIQGKINQAMNEQLDEMERQYSVKERLVAINQDSARKKERQIKIILGSSSLFMVGILALVGYLSGVLSLAQLGGIMVVICLLVVLMVFYFQVNVNQEFRKLEKELQKLPKELVQEGDRLNEAALEWVDKNCDCDDSKST